MIDEIRPSDTLSVLFVWPSSNVDVSCWLADTVSLQQYEISRGNLKTLHLKKNNVPTDYQVVVVVVVLTLTHRQNQGRGHTKVAGALGRSEKP